MTIKVLFFAALAEQVGRREEALDLPAGATVGAALDALGRAHPAVAAMRGRLAAAVNLAYAPAARPLVDGDELALIPPVSGG